MDSPATATAAWWKAWLAAVVGCPLLAFCAASFGNEHIQNALLVGCCIGVLLHFVASIVIAGRIAAKRSPQASVPARIGVVLGLLFGGWAVMATVSFAGCMVAVARTAHH